MCEMDTDSAYITISRERLVFSQTRTELNSTKINVTGFQEPIRLNIKPMIRESQGYLKSNGKDKGSWVCVLRLQDVLLYCYPKRKVLEDGVSTLPLEI